MAALPSSISTATPVFLPGPRRLHSRFHIPATPAPRLREKAPLHVAHNSRHPISLFNLTRASLTNPNQRAHTVYASSNTNGGAAKDKADTNVADSPPLATILAGVVVFLLFCLVVGSIVMWLIGLIVNPPSS